MKCENHFTGILLLAQTAEDKTFSRLLTAANGDGSRRVPGLATWEFYRTKEDVSLYAKAGDSKTLLLISGRQIQTSEGLEVLALGSSGQYKDGFQIEDLINNIIEHNEIPVLPWGVGKWLGRRGRIVTSLIESMNNCSLFLGDNSGRPVFWRQPRQFSIAKAKGISILPGSDPLPFPLHEAGLGNFGFTLDSDIDALEPCKSLKNILSNQKSNVCAYGKLEKTWRFFINQSRMQLAKWR